MDKEDKSERGTDTEAGEDPLIEQEETSGEDEEPTEEGVQRGGGEPEKLREELERKRVEMERGRVGGYSEETRQPYPYSPEYYYLKVR